MVPKPTRTRGVWFWAIAAAAASLIVLFAGSQIAHDRGQSVEWYTGFGQWLGALSSFIAAVVALWIAVSDRRHVEKQLLADLAREAGLVRVTADIFYERDATNAPIRMAGVKANNRRTGRIFEIEVTRFVMGGREVSPLRLSSVELHPKPKGSYYTAADLPHLSIESDQSLYLYPNELPNNPADYVALAYTDSSGRRWQVDTDGKVVQRVI
ncbi:hypothetical protein [Mycobacterium marseillense]|uniref:Uncharacterized protein n=1 Tax=Mycobacterium marseillense TaxID=701042 RepID=A0ABM7JB41_9MYCO|nr:hypothetical protein [Mycobacterium marseillense]MCV7404503.1 hypothetical protein [Mycobacterium marseillense]BBY11007.1 hypothetical protein MMARJ_17470 [Mycobacterium marseillense]